MSAVAAVAARLRDTHGLVDDGGALDLQAALGRLAEGRETHEVVAARVLADRGAWQQLVDLFVVGETHLMRHPRQLERIVAHVAERLATDPVVWCAGASSGEEPWSIALLAERELGAAGLARLRVQATDVSSAAIARARAGHYSRWSLRGCPDWVRAAVGDPPRIPPQLGAVVSFDVDDIVERARRFAPSSLDVVCFRNVALYLTDAYREAFFAAAAAALRDDGLLVLGPADPRPSAGFVVDRSDADRCVFVKREGASEAPGPDSRGRRRRASVTAVDTAPVAPARRAPRRRPAAPADQSRGPSPDTAAPADAVDAALHAAAALADAGRVGDARALVDAVLAGLAGTDPRAGRAWRLRGVTLLDEDPAAASDALRRALFFSPDDAEARALYGLALTRIGRDASARTQLEAARRALGATPGDDELRAVIEAALAGKGAGR